MNGSISGMAPSCSKVVDLKLIVGGRSWKLAQVGRETFVPAEKMEPMDACEGQIVITVEGRASVFNVKLIYGVVPFDDETMEIPIQLLSQNPEC